MSKRDSKLSKIEELYRQNPSMVLTIKQSPSEGNTYRTVRAPLPDGFGMSVGSAFTDPNNIDLSEQASGRLGNIAGSVMKNASMFSGISTKIVQKTNVFYDGPESTEISFDLNFNAYYSAYDEVVRPVAKLMMMSTGSEEPASELLDSARSKISTEEEEELKAASEKGGRFSSLLNGFGLIRAPGICRLSFGKTLTIPRAYISSVGVQFSNVLDNQGYPMSAQCSITVKVVRNPSQTEVKKNYFNNINTVD